MKALIVEDDRLNLKYAAQILKGHGLSHDSAASGTEALRRLKRTRYDVVLMDIGLPDIGGDKVIGLVKATMGPNRETPVVAVTAYAFPRDRDRFLAAGATGYVSKPFDITDLMQAVCESLLAGLEPGPAHVLLSGQAASGDFGRFIKTYAKLREKGVIAMDKNSVFREEHVSRDQLAKLFEDLAMGFRSGKVSMRHGMDSVELAPPNVVYLEAELSMKKRKEKIEIEISWKRPEAATPDATDTIGPVGPVA